MPPTFWWQWVLAWGFTHAKQAFCPDATSSPSEGIFAVLNNMNMREMILEETESSSEEISEDGTFNSRFPWTAWFYITYVKTLAVIVPLRSSSTNNESTDVCQVYLHHQVAQSVVVTWDSSPIFRERSPPKIVLCLFLEKHMNLLRRKNPH